MTKDNWIKAYKDELMSPMNTVLNDMEFRKERVDYISDVLERVYDLAIEKTNKRWESKPPEIKTELPFSATINGVPHVLTSISEQNFASILRGATPDGKITLTFTKSDLLGDKK